MALLIFVVVVLILAALAVWMVRSMPAIPSPFNWIIQVLIGLIAFILIANRAGLI
jgi:hypothetical protein